MREMPRLALAEQGTTTLEQHWPGSVVEQRTGNVSVDGLHGILFVARALPRIRRGLDRALAVAAMVLAAALVAGSASAQGLPAGAIVAVDMDAGTGARGALFRVDPASGNRTLVSDFGNAAQGPLGVHPFVLAFAPAGLVVVDQRAGTPCLFPSSGCGALFFVNPVTGARTLLSDFGDPAQGPTGLRLYGIAVEANGDLLVIDRDTGGVGRGLLFRVSPADGTRTIVSNFANPAQGPLGGDPSGIAIEASGAVLVADANSNGFPSGLVFRIDPSSGQRTIVSDFNNPAQGPIGFVIIDVQPGLGGVLWVVDQVGEQVPGSVGYGQLFRVDDSTGARSVVSDFTTAAQGPVGYNQNDVKLSASGSVLVMDFDAGTNSRGALFAVDPVTGSRSYLSDFGDAAQGALGVEPSGFALAPETPNTLTIVTQGTGTGIVVSNPPGIDCGGDCTEDYAPTQVVVLTTLTAGNSRFAGWLGHVDCLDGIVQMNAGRRCIATFHRRGASIIIAPDLTTFPHFPRDEYDFGFTLVPQSLEDDRVYDVEVGLFRNLGLGPAGPSVGRLYLSSDRRVSGDDVLVSQVAFPDMPAGPSFAVAPEPAKNAFQGLRGRYYLILLIDATNLVDESNESNNVLAQAYDFPCGVIRFSNQFCVPVP